jgi:FKBP-type peptidyl-prolyl cis-trans isomerase FkpA
VGFIELDGTVDNAWLRAVALCVRAIGNVASFQLALRPSCPCRHQETLMRRAPVALVISFGLLAATASLQAQNLQTDQDKTLYALGLAIGDNVKDFNLTAAELTLVAAGISDAALGREPKVDLAVYGPQIQALAQQRMSAAATAEKTASGVFLDRMSKEAGAQRSESGVIFIPVTAGTGANPTAESTVRVHYHGTLRDGSVFDSSVQRGEPISFPLGGVIPCWTEGVQKLKVGGKAKLVCPSDTAYGDNGQGPIPGGAAVMFEVELLGIE